MYYDRRDVSVRSCLLIALVLSLCFLGLEMLNWSSRTAFVAQATTHPWDAYNYAPAATRTLKPVSIYKTNGAATNATNLLSGKATRLSGNGSSVTLDFGKEVGGIVTLTFAGSSDTNQRVGLAFSESSLYVANSSDASSGGGADGAIYAAVAGASSYTMPDDKLRGGFRYLTLFLNSSGWVDINGIVLNFTAEPAMKNLAAYPNYFYSNDNLLNQIWYAGAYTVQMDTIESHTGPCLGTTNVRLGG